MKKFKILIALVLSFYSTYSQTYVFQNEEKLIKQKKPEKWYSELNYNNKTFIWCDKFSKTDSCFNIEKSYILKLENDTIFIYATNKNSKYQKHPQYSLLKSDTLTFLEENIEGLNNGSTLGNTVYLKDTVLTLQNKIYNCYLFLRLSQNRVNITKEYIYMDKQTFIPIKRETFYYDSKSNRLTKAYKKFKLIYIENKK